MEMNRAKAKEVIRKPSEESLVQELKHRALKVIL